MGGMTKHTSVKDRSVRANGVDVHYLEYGVGRPLVLLHGGVVSTNPIWTGIPIAYASCTEALGPHFRVVAPDTRGGGRTRHSAGPMTFDVLADDAAALIETLELERPVVAGFSEGGITATVLAIRHPDAVSSIVNDAGFDVFDPETPTIAMMRQMLGGSPDATAADPDLAAKQFEASNEMRAMFELMKRDQDEGQGEGSWRNYLQLSWERVMSFPGYTYADLARIAVPTLILCGDRDEHCPVEQAVEAYRELPKGELAILPGHGHYIPPAAIEATIEFLERRTGGA
jgi:pimeloyl-ACP methyl ester carboxylesterase